jgi:superoxide reductase
MLAKTALATAAAALPAAALAQYGTSQGSGMNQGAMGMGSGMDAELNIVFTEENPGHWQSLAQLHVPNVSVSGNQLSIVTPHPITEAHYIVSHTVVLENGQFLDRKTFSWKDQPASKHTLPAGYSGKVTVTSTCNLHDFWVKTMSV